MTNDQRQQLKRLKADTIARCTEIIAEHHEINPVRIFTETQVKCPKIREARSILMYHLYECGMTFDRVAKLVSRSPDFCRRSINQSSISLMDDDRELLASLPMIPRSLEITGAAS